MKRITNRPTKSDGWRNSFFKGAAYFAFHTMPCNALTTPQLNFIQPIWLDETDILLESHQSTLPCDHDKREPGCVLSYLESDGSSGVLVLTEPHVEAGPTARVAGVFLLLTEAGSLVENLLDVAAELQ